MRHIHTDIYGGACRWRRVMSAVACSPQPAGLPIVTPTMLPQVFSSVHITAIPWMLVQICSAAALVCV